VDPLTHALATYTLQRAAFPRLSRTATITVVLAGVIADADLLSTYFGPSAYLAFDRTYFHSLPAALVFALLATLPFFFLRPKSSESPVSHTAIFAAALAAVTGLASLGIEFLASRHSVRPSSQRILAVGWIAVLGEKGANPEDERAHSKPYGLRGH